MIFKITTILLCLTIAIASINDVKSNETNEPKIIAYPSDYVDSLLKSNEKLQKLKSSKRNKDQQFSILQNLNYKNIRSSIENIANEIVNLNNIGYLNEQLPNVSLPCLSQVLEFSQGAQDKALWALRVIDAFGKPSAGILQGSLLWVGSYSECLNVKVDNSSWTSNYCKYTSSPLNPPVLIYGLCMPSKCSEDDIVNLVNFGIEKIGYNISQIFPKFNTSNLPVVKKESIMCIKEKKFDAGAVLAIIILSILGFIVTCATVLDIYEQHYATKLNTNTSNLNETHYGHLNNSEKNDSEKIELVVQSKKHTSLFDVLKTFSVYTNTKKLFHITHNPDQISCINGIRVLSFTWVVAGHSYSNPLAISNNQAIGMSWVQRFSFLSISNAFFSVDSFFLMSGILTSYMFMKELNKRNRSLTPKFMLMFYVHRLWRITPVYMITVMISVTLSKYFGDGPLYTETGFDAPKCYWWANLFYINNLVPIEHICLGVSWYLSNDMQFHWIAPLILIPLFLEKRIIGIAMSGLVLLVSFLSILILLLNNRGLEMGLFGQNPLNFMKKIYITPWCRIGPFIVGLLYGYVIYLHKANKLKFKLTESLNLLGWAVSLTLVGLLIFCLYPDFEASGQPLSRTAHIFYQMFSRTAWGLALGYIIFACCTGNGGFINTILSWDIWVPFSRLSFSAYLVHWMILQTFYMSNEQPFAIQDWIMVYFYISHLVLSFVAAYFLSMFVEVPIIGLEKFIFK